MAETVISCEHLTHWYGKRKIYEDLNFEVKQGSIVGLLGKNGTGKTTTINILMGYLKPLSGECRIFGEHAQKISPATRARIALLLEGHVQYSYMTIEQIEKFYSAFYPKWKKEAYYELMRKLKVAPGQKISRMSNGQRSQVALGLILAQDADLLVLDDFTLGLDPGYRRLFSEYLREYAKAEDKTVFVTSHIIQDMERLVDECIVMDYGRILVQKPLGYLLDNFRRFTFNTQASDLPQMEGIFNPGVIRGSGELYSFLPDDNVRQILEGTGVPFADLQSSKIDLEDIFIGLTGKY
ncbi:MAG: ABC transporter ATP-binding protein [Bacteroidales bacterium]|nr:ABC transporter ATP-binding protein [Bacteroidales bacterium]MBR6362173.1 ABC transporter ATP-binding protein [Bacteroidales bacterium]